MTTRDRRSSPFVGRQREMAELTDALSGRGQMVMLAGEPGIGKTRTAQELATLALAKGVRILWGRCYEQEGAPPYWPWVQIMRAYVQQAGAEQLTTEMGAGAAGIAEIIPEIRGKLTDLETLPALEPDQARFRLFDSITTFLKNASQNQTLMLVLDDLHWADRSSLLLLEFLVRELGESRLLLVGCYRDTELSQQPLLAETLAQLSREPTFRRQVLRGLGQDELGRFIETTTGVQPSPELTDELYAHTEGNPFFMTEVIRLMSESGDLTAGHIGTPGGLRIPDGVREVIGQRLNRLSAQCNELLTSASIIGREFDFGLLNILNGAMSEDQLLQAVDQAVSFHLIEEVPGQMDRYQFGHSLIQQALADGVTTSRRVRLHARIAEALEALYGDDAEAHAEELAHHFAEAQTSTGPDQLVRYSLLSGEQALASYAYEDALAHFEKGLAAREMPLSGTEAASDEEAAALLFGFARAQSVTLPRHRLAEVGKTIRPAFDYYVRVGDVTQAMAITEYIGGLSGGPNAVEILTEALNFVPVGSPQSGRILTRYAAILDTSLGEHNAAIDALDQALEIAQRENDVVMEIQVLARMAVLQYMQLDYRQSLDKCLRAIELIPLISRPSDYPIYWYAVRDLIALGRIGEAWPHAARQLELAEESRSRFDLAQALHANGFLAYLEGNWEAAREFSDRGLKIDHRDVRLLNWRSDLENGLGNFADGELYLDRILETVRLAPSDIPQLDHQVVPLTIGVAARITGVASRFEAAASAAEFVLSSPSGLQPRTAQLSRTGLALLAVQMGDVSAAKEQYSFLKSWPISRTPLNLMCGYGVLGLLAQTIGNLDDATGHFEDALGFCRRAGYRPDLAWPGPAMTSLTHSCNAIAVVKVQKHFLCWRSRSLSPPNWVCAR